MKLAFLVTGFMLLQVGIKAQTCAHVAEELEKVWSLVYSGKPYELSLRISFVSEQDQLNEATRIVVAGSGNRIFYTINDKIDVAYGDGLAVQVYHPHKTIYITNDTFTQKPFSQWLTLSKGDTSRGVDCKMEDLPDGRRVVDFGGTTERDRTKLYYSSSTFKPDSSVVLVSEEVEAMGKTTKQSGTMRIYYDVYRELALANEPIGPDRIIDRRGAVWTPRPAYVGYEIKFIPVLHVNLNK